MSRFVLDRHWHRRARKGELERLVVLHPGQRIDDASRDGELRELP